MVPGNPSTIRRTYLYYLQSRLDTCGPHERLYVGHQAHRHAQTRAIHSCQPYRMHHDRLFDWTIKRVEKGWTPQEISGRLNIDCGDDPRMRASPETIYAWIYSPAQKH